MMNVIWFGKEFVRAEKFESRCEGSWGKWKAETWRVVAEINRLVNTVLIKKSVVFRKVQRSEEGGTTAEEWMQWISTTRYRPSFGMVPLNEVESTQSQWLGISPLHQSNTAMFVDGFLARFNCLFTSLVLPCYHSSALAENYNFY